MDNTEYLRRFRAAVATVMTNPEKYMEGCGLCHALTYANKRNECFDGYIFMNRFMDYSGYLPEEGVLTPLRMNILCLLSEMDDDTIIFIRNL